MHTARLTLTGPRRRVVQQALQQETAPRAGISMEEVGQELHITIVAASVAHLRAACNSLLHWVDLVERIGEAVDTSRWSPTQ